MPDEGWVEMSPPTTHDQSLDLDVTGNESRDFEIPGPLSPVSPFSPSTSVRSSDLDGRHDNARGTIDHASRDSSGPAQSLSEVSNLLRAEFMQHQKDPNWLRRRDGQFYDFQLFLYLILIDFLLFEFLSLLSAFHVDLDRRSHGLFSVSNSFG